MGRETRKDFKPTTKLPHYPHRYMLDQDRIGPGSVRVTTATVRLPWNPQGQNRKKARDTVIDGGPNLPCPYGDSTTKYR